MMLSACKCVMLGFLLIANLAGLVQAAEANQTSIGSSHIPETVQNLGNNSSNITTIVSPGESIQAAIQASLPGNIIEVQSGTYHEKINITKQLVIRGVDVGKGLPVVDAGGEGSAIKITADGVQLESLVVMNASGFGAGSGIKVTSKDCIIMNNSAHNNPDGIALLNSDNNTLINNNLSKNGYGIYLSSSANNTLFGNSLGNNEYGILLSSSTNNTAFGNNLSSNNGYGISLLSSDNNSLLSNNLSDDRYSGIRLDSSNKNTISNNHIRGIISGKGIEFYESNNNTLFGNNFSNNGYGISLSSSGHNRLSNNSMSGNRHNFQMDGEQITDFDNDIDVTNLVNGRPIYYLKDASNKIIGPKFSMILVGCFNCTNVTVHGLIESSSDSRILFVNTHNSTVMENRLRNLQEGIQLYFSNDNTISENNVSENFYGILLSSSNHNILISNNLSNNSIGVQITSSNNNTFISNKLSNNSNGIIFTLSNNNTLANNDLRNSSHSVLFTSSNNNILNSNNFSNNGNSIELTTSYNNTILRNNLSRNNYGISLSSSKDNRLRENLMFGNRRNFKIDGRLISDYDNDIDATNLINGRPIYYLKDANNETIDSNSNAGLVGCFNCTNITIRGLSISDVETGIGLYRTNHSLVEYNNLTDLVEGVYLYFSNDNTIRFNTVNNSDYGIRIESADNNSVENNSVSNNTSNPIVYDEFRNNKFANNSENASEFPEWMAMDGGIDGGIDFWRFTSSETAAISAPDDGGEVPNLPSETVIGANSAPSSSPSKSSGGGDSYGNLRQLNSPSYAQPDDADLKKLFGGIISFKPKIPMVVNETTDVAASIAPNNTQANKTLYDLKETDTGLVIKGLTISRWMSLKLEDPEEEFQIKALSTEKQEILEDVPATWRWTVRPKEEGKHPLILVATLLNSSNKEPIRDVDVHTEQIEVIANKNETPIEPSPIVPIGNAWKDISSLTTTVVGLLTGIFGLILLYRKLKKGESD